MSEQERVYTISRWYDPNTGYAKGWYLFSENGVEHGRNITFNRAVRYVVALENARSLPEWSGRTARGARVPEVLGHRTGQHYR